MMLLSYHIQYGEREKNRSESCFLFRFFMTGIFFVLFLVTVSVFWPEGREVLRLLLIPDKTLDAAETFVSELDCGFSLKTAASDFFQKLAGHEAIH